MKFRTVIRWFGGIALSIAISLGITTAKLAWNRSQAMQEVAAEVVHHCPTGALNFKTDHAEAVSGQH